VRYKNRILIVDDDPLKVKLLAAKLPPEQYEVIKAESAERVKKIIHVYSFLGGSAWPPTSLTVSIGVAESSASLAIAEKLIQRADEGLTRAKKEGKTGFVSIISFRGNFRK